MPLTFKELKEFTVQQLATLKKEYEPMRGKTISIDNAKKMSNMLDKMTKDMLKKLANADIPFISTGASSKLVIKHGMKPADIKETINLEEADELQQEACWTGYKQVGFKKSSRTGKRVPNCVPESVAREMKEQIDAMTQYAVYDMSFNSKILSIQKSMQNARDYKKEYEKLTKGDSRFKNIRLKIAALKPQSGAKMGSALSSFMIAKDNSGRPVVEEVEDLKEYKDYLEYMCKNPGQARTVARMFDGKVGGDRKLLLIVQKT